MDSMPTCLFTSVNLPPETEEEHTIPRSLGGRITSRTVSSTEFNHASGDQIDPVLKRVYDPIINHLAPLLPMNSQPGRMQVELQDAVGGCYLEQGELSRNLRIIERDEKEMPKAVVADSETAVRKFAKRMGKHGEDMKLSVVPATDEQTYKVRCPVICHEIEVAVLKSALLTFDPMLAGIPNRFTRSDQLAPVRRFIKEAVMDRRIDPMILNQMSMGLQYDRTGLYQRIRDRVDVERTPFEHFLIVATNLPGRCLELVWLVFGFDPFGFRLCQNWTGDQFAFGVINPVIREGAASGPHTLAPNDELLAIATKNRSTPTFEGDETDPDSILEAVKDRVSEVRGNAQMQAVDLVEHQGDEALKRRLVEAAALADAGKRGFRTRVRERLIGLYGRRASVDGFVAAVDTVVAEQFNLPSNAHIDVEIPSDLESEWPWPDALRLYRMCLTTLKPRFGLPGDWFSDSGRVLADPAAQRLAGDTLDMK